MRYDVRVDDGGRFEHEQDQPLAVGDWITLPGIGYRVMSIQSLTVEESGVFDAIVEVSREEEATVVRIRVVIEVRVARGAQATPLPAVTTRATSAPGSSLGVVVVLFRT